MALFVLGDPHLSLGASKPMDIFPGWNDYVERLEKNWRKLIRPKIPSCWQVTSAGPCA